MVVIGTAAEAIPAIDSTSAMAAISTIGRAMRRKRRTSIEALLSSKWPGAHYSLQPGIGLVRRPYNRSGPLAQWQSRGLLTLVSQVRSLHGPPLCDVPAGLKTHTPLGPAE